MGVEVRAAVEGDIAGVMALEGATAEAPGWAEGEYRGRIVAQEGLLVKTLLVAVEGAVLVGYVGARVLAGEAELETVAVDAGWRRRGVGRALCRAAMEWSVAAGASEMVLEVRAGSAGAQALYRELGFGEIGRRRGYYRSPEEEAVVMRVELG